MIGLEGRLAGQGGWHEGSVGPTFTRLQDIGTAVTDILNAVPRPMSHAVLRFLESCHLLCVHPKGFKNVIK